MMDSTSKDLNKSARQKRILVVFVLAAFVVILCLASASFATTQVMWDGMYPSGEYHLQIQDETGNSIEGAALNVYDRNGKKYAFQYPFDNYVSENSLVSNSDGEIIVTHLPRGLEFGGSGWYLFWFIPIGIGGPDFACEVSANEYKISRFSCQEIFDVAYDAYNNGNGSQKTIQVNGNEFHMMILKKSIVLKPK